MRSIRFAAAAMAAACVLAGGDAVAQTSAWCAVVTQDAEENCGFSTVEQCSANVAGVGGRCIRNYLAQMTVPAPDSAPAPPPSRPVRKKPKSKPVSTRTRATNPGAAAGAPANPPIPLPNRALLAPPPTFDCAFKSGDDARAPQLASQAGSQPGAEATRAMTLDYERQCHRQAAMILRDRLSSLQAAIGETIKAAGRSGQSAIPLPNRALLASAAQFDCEFKAASPDEARGPAQASAAAGPTTQSADAARLAKLDYERQCYRHTEMIARDQLRRLQAAVGPTINAVGRSAKPPAP